MFALCNPVFKCSAAKRCFLTIRKSQIRRGMFGGLGIRKLAFSDDRASENQRLVEPGSFRWWFFMFLSSTRQCAAYFQNEVRDF